MCLVFNISQIVLEISHIRNTTLFWRTAYFLHFPVISCKRNKHQQLLKNIFYHNLFIYWAYPSVRMLYLILNFSHILFKSYRLTYMYIDLCVNSYQYILTFPSNYSVVTRFNTPFNTLCWSGIMLGHYSSMVLCYE